MGACIISGLWEREEGDILEMNFNTEGRGVSFKNHT